jgi:hypothetical protein
VFSHVIETQKIDMEELLRRKATTPKDLSGLISRNKKAKEEKCGAMYEESGLSGLAC